MFISITTDYFCAQKIGRSNNSKTRKIFLILSIVINLSILGFFKYVNFFADNLSHLLDVCGLSWTWLNTLPTIILPIGISFYTFEAISYTADVYLKKTKPARSYWDYVLFVIYFPHLVAGPIMRARTFLPQITTPRVLSWPQFYEGAALFFWGLFEKMFVADNLARIVNPIFASSPPYEGAQVLLALYAFSFQIFCDFDGYSNMARGLGKCMGFDITINFKWPYFSTNPREFWQRWHISLSTWLRDYVYIPLGGNRNGKLHMYGAIILTMLLGGLWHGASWTFVFWGAYQAILLVGHRFIEQDKPKPSNPGLLKNLIKILGFYHLVLLGWLFFRAQSMDQVIQMLQALGSNFQIQNILSGLSLVGFIAPLLIIQIWQYKFKDLEIVSKQHWTLRMFIYALMVYLLIGWGVMKAEEFVYFQF